MATQPTRQRFKFPRTRRLTGQKAFARVFGTRCSASNRHLVIYAAANGLPYSRMGLSVGRRLGGAVVRNRIKRLLREAFRLEQTDIPLGYDLVVIPRPGAAATLKELQASLKSVAARAAARSTSGNTGGNKPNRS